jgi:serine/threonine protein kinase
MAKSKNSAEKLGNDLPPGLAKRYTVEKLLGEGGMGYVYLAQDKELPRKVAIKTIRAELSTDEGVRKRIERECRYHAQIGTHPNIIALYDKVEEAGQIHLILEYVPGETLAQVCDRFRRNGQSFPLGEALSIIIQATNALAHIHANGIVHRDIKPDNLLVYIDQEEKFYVKLMDFGIARLKSQDSDNTTMLTQAGWTGPGTPAYMAPEQIDGATFGEIGPPTDIYAAGIMLYNVLAGRTPFKGTLTEVYTGHLAKTPPPLHLDAAVSTPINRIIEKALAKRPEERYQTAKEFGDALRAVAKLVEDNEIDDDRTVLAGPATTVADVSEDDKTVAFDNGKTVVATANRSSTADVGRTQVYNTATRQPQKKPWLAIAGGVVVLLVAGSAYFLWATRTPSEIKNTQAVTKPAANAVPENNSGSEATNKPATTATGQSTPQQNPAPATNTANTATPQPSSTGSALDELLRERAPQDAASVPDSQPQKTKDTPSPAKRGGATASARKQPSNPPDTQRKRRLEPHPKPANTDDGWIVINKEDKRLDK